MNKVILMGRLTKDPELKSTPTGVNVASFTLAVPRRFKKDEVDFINCVAWRQTGEFITSWFKKGNMISVVGSMQVRTWEDQNQKKHYITEVMVDEAYFTGEAKSDSERPSAPTYLGDTGEDAPEYDIDDEDLPF